MARGVKGTGPYSKAAKKVVAPKAPPEPTAKQYLITINEYDNDPEFYVTAFSAGEAVIKAVNEFRKLFPKEDVNDLTIQETSEAKRYLVL